MNYIVIKKTLRFEYRLYLDNDIDGKVIFKGHKLAPEENLLKDILDIKTINGDYRKMFYLYDINKWETINDFSVGIRKSWESLLSLIKTNKITITVFNI
jgi:hypothetical protein